MVFRIEHCEVEVPILFPKEERKGSTLLRTRGPRLREQPESFGVQGGRTRVCPSSRGPERPLSPPNPDLPESVQNQSPQHPRYLGPRKKEFGSN